MRETIAAALRRVADSPRTATPIDRFSDYDLNRGGDVPWAAAPAAAGGRNAGLQPAAVLVAIVEHARGPTVLLTQRTQHLSSHPGQISFPGGRAEDRDCGPVDTALREAEEEVGLTPSLVEVAGCLDDYETRTGYLVKPVVGFVQPGFELTLDAFEVAEAFEVPLAFLFDERNRQVHAREYGGVMRRYYAFEYEGRYIWGATAGMLVSFQRRAAGPIAPDGAPC